MATALASDFKVYQEEFQAGMWEALSQNSTAFNAASRNAIRLVTRERVGDYAKEAIFKTISNLYTRRNTATTSAASAVKPTQDELISVKVHRKLGPVEFTLDAIRKIGKDQREMSFVLGQMAGQAKTQDLLNTGILAVEAAIEGQSTALNYDASALSVKTLVSANLANALKLMGDAGDRVVCWVMHSKPFYDLMLHQLTSNVTNIADRIVYAANVGSLNRPVVVADIPALWDANTSLTDTYNVLGLVQDAVVVEESEAEEIVTEVVTGLENLVVRVQGESAFNLGVKGMKWNIAGGGAGPTDTALGTASNWTQVATSDKDLAGVRIKCQ